MDLVEFLSSQENQLIVVLAIIVVNLSGVIVYQWKYTHEKTVPKWAWKDLVEKIEKIRDKQLTEFEKIREILRHID